VNFQCLVYNVDTEFLMKKPELITIHKIIGVTLILVGILSYVLPVPGSTLLVVLGIVWLLGRNKAGRFLKKVFGEKVFKLLKIKNAIKKI